MSSSQVIPEASARHFEPFRGMHIIQRALYFFVISLTAISAELIVASLTFAALIRQQLGPSCEFTFLDGEVECDAAPGTRVTLLRYIFDMTFAYI
jgi:hypothetical protein